MVNTSPAQNFLRLLLPMLHTNYSPSVLEVSWMQSVLDLRAVPEVCQNLSKSSGGCCPCLAGPWAKVSIPCIVISPVYVALLLWLTSEPVEQMALHMCHALVLQTCKHPGVVGLVSCLTSRMVSSDCSLLRKPKRV